MTHNKTKKKQTQEHTLRLKDALSRAADDFICVDSNYQQTKLTDNSGKTETFKDSLAYFRSQMVGKKYDVCEKKQQTYWTGKKSECQKLLAINILKFESVVSNLLKLTERSNGTVKYIFGEFKEDENGKFISYDRSKELLIEVNKLATHYLSNKNDANFDNFVNIVVNKYNLSYCHFIKPESERLWKNYENVRKNNLDPLDEIDISKNYTLFPDYPQGILDFEHVEHLSWNAIVNIQRENYLLNKRIIELKNILVTTNLRNCISTALNYYYRNGGNRKNGMNHMDLISEGSMGLMYAADMYVHGSSSKFNTYADYWVKLKIGRYIKNNNPILIPLYVNDIINNVLKVFYLYKKINNNNNLPSKDYVINELQLTKISDQIWKMALNRYHSIPVNINCSGALNNSEDDGGIDFDAFVEPTTEDAINLNDIQFENHMTLAEKTLSPLHYVLLKLKHIDNKTNKFISEFIGNGFTSSYVRSECKKAEREFKNKLNG